MSYFRSFRAIAIFVGLIVPVQAMALEFVSVGPRATGMGGAGVAITTDALATYWNPAGLAMTQTLDVRLQGGGQVIDRLGIADAVHDLESFNPNDPNAAAKAQDIANRINKPGATVSVNGSALYQRTSGRTCIRCEHLGRGDRRRIRQYTSDGDSKRQLERCYGPPRVRGQTGGVFLCVCLLR